MSVNAINRQIQFKLERFLIGFALLLALITVPLYAFKVSQKIDYTDFDVYYRAAVRVKNSDWQQMYNLGDGASPLRYAPPLLPFLRPLAELERTPALITWYFLQCIAFGLGFYWIYKALRALEEQTSRKAGVGTCFAFLFILRFCLDTLTIGQVSGLMFFGYCWGLFAWTTRKSAQTVVGISIPALFKIGPGFLFGLFTSESWKEKSKAVLVFLSLIFLVGGGTYLWLGPTLNHQLWTQWASIVAKDDQYYDSSHYGSQSLNSVLLRMVNWGWINISAANEIRFGLALVICLGIVGFWIFRKPKSNYGRSLFYSLGLFANFWVMPETFKYSLTPLAIPAALLWVAPSKTQITQIALFVGCLVLSLAGKDLVGDTLFFGNQLYNIPFFATLLIGAAIFQLAWRESAPSFKMRKKALDPWPELPNTTRDLKTSVLAAISTDEFSFLSCERVNKFLSDYSKFLQSKIENSFEIIVVLYGESMDRESVSDFPTLAELTFLRVIRKTDLQGRGSALRTAFLNSRGQQIFIANPEQPCQIDFFAQALIQLKDEFELVRTNRFILYSRPFAMTWKVASILFALQNVAGSLFDLEINLIARSQKLKTLDLPATVGRNEKSLRRLCLDGVSIFVGLPILLWRSLRGYYQGDASLSLEKITADDWGLSAGVNRGILELAQRGIVKRVSLMATGTHLEDGLKKLCDIPGIELGLHFNLTYGRGLQSSPSRFLLEWLNPFQDRQIRRQQVRTEFSSQLQLLKKAGVQVNYVDGHHHIHLVPGIIDALSDLMMSSGIRSIRLPYDASLLWSSQMPLVFLSLLARPRMIHHGFHFLPCVYPKRGYHLDQGKLRAQLRKNPTSEVIVHPAKENDLETLEYPDSYTEGRVMEFQALRMLKLDLHEEKKTSN